ncbi:5-formyltetrahydrofolate cyclo-ligase [soil metagenome]
MHDSVSDRKRNLRKTFLAVRKSLSDKEIERMSKKITDRLTSQPFFLRSQTIHMYVSIKENSEVLTRDLIRCSLEKGKRVVVPKMESESRLSHHQITSATEFKSTRWGVSEPVNVRPVHSNEISLVIVPMVAADFKKNRLGYGMGYYDRFLSKTNAHRVGLCFNCTLSWVSLPTDNFDQSMDTIITESAIL